MISNQSTLPSPAAAALGAAAPAEATKAPAGEPGAASAFAALLGQLYQPVPVAIAPVPMTAKPPIEGQAETATSDAGLHEQGADAGADQGTAVLTPPAADESTTARPVVLPPFVSPVLTPRAPRAVTAAIGAALRHHPHMLPVDGKHPVAKPLPVTPPTARQADPASDIADDTAIAASEAPQGSAGAILASVMMQASAAAQLKTEAAEPADTPTPEASSNASLAVSAGANSPASTAGGLGAASPMVRAMTMLLDALGVTDRNKHPAPKIDIKVDSATPTETKSDADPIGRPAQAQPAMTVSLQAADVKAKPETPVEAAAGDKQAPIGAIVSKSPGGDHAAPGQGDAHGHHDNHDNVHHLHGEAQSASASSDQGASGWSGTLGGAIRQGIAATEASEIGRAGATAHVPRGEPTAQPASTSQVTMDLDPTMGTLGKIRVAVRGDMVHATITTQDNDAAALGIRAHELRQALEQRGFADARVTVRTSGTEDNASSIIASSATEIRPRTIETSSSSKSNSDSQQQPRGERRDQTGGDRSDTRRQRNRQEQNQ